MFYFMFTFEFCECCTAPTLMIRAVFRCSSLCSLGYNFVTKVFELVLYSYASNVLLQLQTFLEIAFALERIKAFSKSTTTKMKFKKQLIIMLIVAAISAMPNYLIKKSIAAFGVLDNTNQTVYRIVTRDFAQNNTWTVILFVILVLRTLALSFVILIVNVTAIFKYKKLMREKEILLFGQNTSDLNESRRKSVAKKFRKKVKKETRITRILLAMSINYLIGNLPCNLTVFILQKLGATSIIYNYYSMSALVFTLFSHGMYTFLYYFLNPTYKNSLFQLFGQKINQTNSIKSIYFL